MKRNRFMSVILYIAINIYMLLVGYIVSLFISGAFLAFVMAVWSAISEPPFILLDKWWLFYLLSSIPVGLGCYIYQLIAFIKNLHLKQDNKQDNGNQ